jgi:hypothetical protein
MAIMPASCAVESLETVNVFEDSFRRVSKSLRRKTCVVHVVSDMEYNGKKT